jgi:hypothetical protein
MQQNWPYAALLRGRYPIFGSCVLKLIPNSMHSFSLWDCEQRAYSQIYYPSMIMSNRTQITQFSPSHCCIGHSHEIGFTANWWIVQLSPFYLIILCVWECLFKHPISRISLSWPSTKIQSSLLFSSTLLLYKMWACIEQPQVIYWIFIIESHSPVNGNDADDRYFLTHIHTLWPLMQCAW